eukprot:9486193-Pyramimonas_sp.AAC.1
MTCRCVLALLHHEWVRISKTVYKGALERHLAALKPLTTKQAFYEGCKADPANTTPEGGDNMDEESKRALSSLELEEPERPQANELLVRRRAAVLYAEVHDKIQKTMEKEEKTRKEKEEQKKRQEEEDSKMKPAEILDELIDRKVDAKLQGRQEEDDEDDRAQQIVDALKEERRKKAKEEAEARNEEKKKKDMQRSEATGKGAPRSSNEKGKNGEKGRKGKKGEKGTGKGKGESYGEGKGKSWPHHAGHGQGNGSSPPGGGGAGKWRHNAWEKTNKSGGWWKGRAAAWLRNA